MTAVAGIDIKWQIPFIYSKCIITVYRKDEYNCTVTMYLCLYAIFKQS